ncbi:SDR family oxidoreductase [Solilutibacter silvestris]|uniref:Dehydrogenase n=1 Tax=Solilutibacter silvestris TaxID=1645665 RepID=A0A2K1PYS1_9GAMM|nr:SDR family oxidoreductase [Lysobacter silvestris]PNS07941.1 Dehydrogenase [Lysobacter silvestris]
MDLDLTGKRALVCGASEGIGRATAHELALLGAEVTVLARRREVLEEVVRALPTPKGQHHGLIVADAADTVGLAEAARELAAHSPVHILINNSGGPPGGRAIDADAGAFLDAYTRHLLANQALAQALVPGMRHAGYGRIVNIISTSVYEPIPGLGVSNTTRGAVASWAKTLSRELAADGITVNNVLPGYTETGRIDQLVRGRMAKEQADEAAIRADMMAGVPAKRFARAEEPAALIAFLCAPVGGYINGQSIAVDGGRMQSI